MFKQNKEKIFEILDYINIILYEKSKSDYRYISCIEYIENTKNRIKQNSNFDMCIDNMLMKIWEEVKL